MAQFVVHAYALNTRKLNYRKDDRARRPIHLCPENFREFPSTPTLLFPKIFNGLVRMDPVNVLPTLKLVALPIPEIIGVLKIIWGNPCIRPCSLFSKIFNGLLFKWTL